MKITKEKLKQIIKEELDEKLNENEGEFDPLRDRWTNEPPPIDVSEDPIGYYYRMQRKSGDPTAYGDRPWTPEDQVKNEIAQTMYNLVQHTIPTINRFPKLIEDTRKMLAKHSTPEAQEALGVLDKLLKDLKMSIVQPKLK